MLSKNVMFILFAYVAVGIAVAYAFIYDDQVEAIAEKSAIESKSLTEARAAFWERDMARAERLYLLITKDNADNTDAWGELGNLYYMQSRWTEAATAYTEATLHLLDSGHFPQAMYLQQLVSRLDGKQAKRIHEHLVTRQSRPQG